MAFRSTLACLLAGSIILAAAGLPAQEAASGLAGLPGLVAGSSFPTSMPSGVAVTYILPGEPAAEIATVVKSVWAGRESVAGPHRIVVIGSREVAEKTATAMGFPAAAVYHDADGSKTSQWAPGGAAILVGQASTQPKAIPLAGATVESIRAAIKAADKGTLPTGTKHYNVSKSGPAVKGYDVVAYQTVGKPTPGNKQITSSYEGLTYQFASAESRSAFAADPARYAPAYGGWCATALVEGDKVDIDPKNFKVSNGRLLLFYKGFLGDALKDWNKGEEAPKLATADQMWSKIAAK